MTSGVIASVESLAAEAGAAILRAGGNATDAALATAFAQGVVDPIYCGIAGGFHGLFHDAALGRTTGRQRRWTRTAPRREPDMWHVTGQWGAMWKVEGNRNRLGYQASMVAGFVRGAHEAYSPLWLRPRRAGGEIIEPAIALAADGFEVYPYLYRLWMPRTERMRNFLESEEGTSGAGPHATPAPRSTSTRTGPCLEIGERLVQTRLRTTLERIAENRVRTSSTRARSRKPDRRRLPAERGPHQPRRPRGLSGGRRRSLAHDASATSTCSPSRAHRRPCHLEILNIIEGWDLQALGWNTPAISIASRGPCTSRSATV